MKIIIFCAYFYPHEGGVERFVKESFSGLKIGRNDIDVTIVTCNTERAASYEKIFGFKVYRLNCKNMLGGTYPVITSSGLKQLKKLENEKFDYVITNTRFFNTSLVGLRFARRNNIPLIHIEHGTCHTKLSSPINSMIVTLYDHTIGRHIIKNADKVVCISDAAREFVNHLYKRKMALVYNSIDARKFKKIDIRKQSLLKKSLGIKKERVITFVGRLIYAKGVQDLLEATKYIDNIKVLIIGDGNYSGELKKKYNSKTFYNDKKFIFLGKKNLDEIITYLSISDIFVNPSYSEGLPTSILEAGAMGLPIIATDVGGTREIIEDGKNGYLVDAGDIEEINSKIIKLLNNVKARLQFSRNIRRKISTVFDIAIAKKKMMDILK